MNYIYDIYINLHKQYYDLFDWEKKDKVIHIKKIPIFKITEVDLQNLIKDDIKLDLEFANKIKDKTILFNNQKKVYLCGFTDSKDEIVVQIGKNGNIIKKSSIHFTDRFDNLKILNSLNYTNLSYEINNTLKLEFLSRKEYEQKIFSLKNIDTLDKEKLIYLYFECFNKKIEDDNRIKREIKKEILENNKDIISITYNFFKLIYQS